LGLEVVLTAGGVGLMVFGLMIATSECAQ
jgi:hypothetical protein